MRENVKLSGKTFVVLIVAALFVAPLASALSNIPNFPELDDIVECDPEFKLHELEVAGANYTGVSGGVIASRVGKEFQTSTGLNAVALTVVGFSDNGHAEGLGEFSFNLDKNRQGGQSWVQDNGDGTLTQVMNLHLVANIEALGGQSLFTSKPATVAADLKTFPEDGAVYHLLEAVELVNAQGKVMATVTGLNVKMAGHQIF